MTSVRVFVARQPGTCLDLIDTNGIRSETAVFLIEKSRLRFFWALNDSLNNLVIVPSIF